MLSSSIQSHFRHVTPTSVGATTRKDIHAVSTPNDTAKEILNKGNAFIAAHIGSIEELISDIQSRFSHPAKGETGSVTDQNQHIKVRLDKLYATAFTSRNPKQAFFLSSVS